ncbi:anti-sigma factor [Acuticoccus sp.]|uniref:anti-sigma factor n=1 Tax=Acuticoccus sp. TaxID=1904378 RepID=UPI003B52910C
MTMTDGDRLDAGAYALALDDGSERARFEAALLDDPELAEAVWMWEERLRPLGEAVPRRRVPARVWRGVESRLFGDELSARRRERRAVSFWRSFAMLFVGLSLAGLAAIAVLVARPDLLGLDGARRAGGEWIAPIVRLDGTIALLKVEPDGTLVVEPFPVLGPDEDAQIWLVPTSGDPVSLGVVTEDGRTRASVPRAAVERLDPSAEVVVTAEPPGGSPTGGPTGRRLGSGSLIEF